MKFHRLAVVLAAVLVLGCGLAAASPPAHPPVLVLQAGHADDVGALAVSADGRLLASGDNHGGIRLWDTATWRILAALNGHRGAVRSLSFSRDGSRLVSGSDDGTARLWDVASGRRLRILMPAGKPIESTVGAVISADGRTVVTAGTIGTADDAPAALQLWDAERGVVTGAVKLPAGTGGAQLAFSADGSRLAVGAGDGETDRISVLEYPGSGSGGQSPTHLPSTADFARSAPASDRPSGDGLAVVRTFTWHHEAASIQVALSPDGSTLAATNFRDEARLWDVASGREVARLVGHAAAFSPDGARLALLGDGPVLRLVDARDGRILRELRGEVAPGRHGGALAWLPDGSRLAATLGPEMAGSSGLRDLDPTIRLWDLNTGRVVERLRGRSAWLLAASFARDGRRLLALGQDGDVDAWSVDTGLPQTVARDVTFDSLLISPGDITGDPTLSQTENRGAWKAATREVRAVLARNPNVAFRPDGHAMASANWHVGAALLRPTAKGLHASPLAGTGASAVVFDPHGRLLAVAEKEQIHLCDAATGHVKATWTTGAGTLADLAFRPDGGLLAAGDTDGRITLWTVPAAKPAGVLKGPAGSGIRSLAFHPGGRLLASGGWDGAVRLWDVRAGKLVATLAGHDAAVNSLTFSPNGKVLASAGDDAALRIWRVSDGAPLATATLLDGGRDWLAIAPEGFFDGSPGGMQGVLLRMGARITDTAEPEQFFDEFYHPGLLADVIREARPIRDILRERGDPRASLTIADKDRRLPHVRILVPGEATSSRVVTVRVAVDEAPADASHPRGSGVRDVRLFRNGTLVTRWSGPQRPGAILDAKVTMVAGENALTAYAYNHDNVKSKDAHAAILGDASLRRAPQAWVLAIGIDRYAIPRFDLKFAAADARETAGRLRRALPFAPAAIHVRTLLDGQATRRGIRDALAAVAREAQPEDTVIVSHSGHGILDQGHLYLIPHDLGAARSYADLARHGVSDRDLESAFLAVQAQHVILILDACHSGQALASDDWRQGPMNARGLMHLAWEKGMDVLTASQSQQAALEAWQVGTRRIGHGLLTYALIDEGLRRAPRHGGRLSARDWLNYAAARVPQMVTGGALRGRDLVLSPKKPRPIQVPRVFYRREGGGEWTVAGISRRSP